ncbi:MAG: ferritin family protein [Candidatus Micrarchaeota archaeon]
MINLYVCKICGEPYLGASAPKDCPFCGAPRKFLKSAGEYSQLWKDIKLKPADEENLKKALAGEVNATYYYGKISNSQEKYSKYNRLFKQLTRVETEHVNTIVKFLGIPYPAIKGEELKGSIKKDLARTKELEAGAVKDYTEFIKTSKSKNVKLLFKALLHAEQGHFDWLDADLKKQ